MNTKLKNFKASIEKPKNKNTYIYYILIKNKPRFYLVFNKNTINNMNLN